jgi:hypothetical protein
VIDDYQKALKRNADQLFVARALWATGTTSTRTNLQLVSIDAQNAEAMVAWGDLAYSTNEADAVLSYEDAPVDPNMPEVARHGAQSARGSENAEGALSARWK